MLDNPTLCRATVNGWRLTLLTGGALIALLWLTLLPQAGRAQENVGVYVVAPGDTLSAIAARYEVPIEALIQLNNIVDPALIQVGQELLIPTQSAALALGVVATEPLYAAAGDSLAAVAARVDQDVELLAALNELTVTAQLWPGQPLLVPAGSIDARAAPFGAIVAMDYTPQIVQGRTGRVAVTADRPISLAMDWNGLPLPLLATPGIATATLTDTVTLTDSASLAFTDASTGAYTVVMEALLPAPALIAPDVYTLTVAYTTTRGVRLARTWPVEIMDGGYAFQNIYVPPEKSATLDPTLSISETELLRATYAPVTTERAWRAPFVRPIGAEFATTSPFGTRRSYNDGVLVGYHSGQDFGAPVGVLVTAPAAGAVVLAQPLTVRGNAVVLDHGQGVYTGYWHLSELRVEPGQQLAPGDAIGLVGNTGRSTGAHLHWELSIDGILVDPMQFLDEPLFSPQP